jgi:hypothetical protein
VPDAAYYETVAAAQQRRDQLMAENQATGERNATTRTAALQSLSAQQPRDTQTLQESRNKQGLYYSGRLGQDMSDLAASYATKRSGVETSFADAERQRLSQQNALQADFANTEREARYGSVEPRGHGRHAGGRCGHPGPDHRHAGSDRRRRHQHRCRAQGAGPQEDRPPPAHCRPTKVLVRTPMSTHDEAVQRMKIGLLPEVQAAAERYRRREPAPEIPLPSPGPEDGKPVVARSPMNLLATGARQDPRLAAFQSIADGH